MSAVHVRRPIYDLHRFFGAFQVGPFGRYMFRHDGSDAFFCHLTPIIHSLPGIPVESVGISDGRSRDIGRGIRMIQVMPLAGGER